jgi:hypothetical protein
VDLRRRRRQHAARVRGAELAASARPPNELRARAVSLTAQGFISDGGPADRAAGLQFTGDWRVSADFPTTSISHDGACRPSSRSCPRQATATSLWLEWRPRAVGGTVDLAAHRAALPAAPRCRRLRVGALRSGDGGATQWRTLRCASRARRPRVWPVAPSAEVESHAMRRARHAPALESAFLRLEDITPFVPPLPDSPVPIRGSRSHRTATSVAHRRAREERRRARLHTVAPVAARARRP